MIDDGKGFTDWLGFGFRFNTPHVKNDNIHLPNYIFYLILNILALAARDAVVVVIRY